MASALALTGGMQSDESETNDYQDGVGSKLRRKASLLSLSSLTHLGQALGMTLMNGPNNSVAGISASLVGIVTEIWIKFSNLSEYINWLAVFRILTAIHVSIPPSLHIDDLIEENGLDSFPKVSNLLTRFTFESERKAISNWIKLLTSVPEQKDSLTNDEKNKTNSFNDIRLMNYLDKRILDIFPLRLSYSKLGFRSVDHRRDQIDNFMGRKTTTLTGTERNSPNSASHVSKNLKIVFLSI